MATNKSLFMNGFKEDCEQLITRFERADNIRFETFCDIWKAMKFSLVFAGRPSFLELLEFCEEALHICKQFILLPPRFKERIGGLYLLYGIYFKMPIDQFRIKIKLDDWKSILELHAEIKEAEHLDANYILCKLIASNAFHFCLFDSEYGMEKPYIVKNSQCFNPYSILPTLKDLSDKNQILSKINELSKAYEQKKEVSKLINLSDASLKLFNSNIAQEIINDIQEFEEQRRDQQKNTIDFEKPSCSTLKGQSSNEHTKFQLRGPVKRKMRPLIDGIEPESESEEGEVLESDDSYSELPIDSIPLTCYCHGRHGPGFQLLIHTDIFFHLDGVMPQPLQNRSTIVQYYSTLTINAIQIIIMWFNYGIQICLKQEFCYKIEKEDTLKLITLTARSIVISTRILL